MKKPVARLVTRMQGEGDGLFIGNVLKNSFDLFEPNTVYELEECQLSGDIVLRKVGKSAISENRVYDSVLSLNWGLEIGNILERGREYMFLSEEELKAYAIYKNAGENKD